MTDEELREALAALFARSGDGELLARCVGALKERAARSDRREWLSRLVRDMWLSEKAIAAGRGIGDAIEFTAWLEDDFGPGMGIEIPGGGALARRSGGAQ